MSTILSSEDLLTILPDDLKQSIKETKVDSICVIPSQVLKFGKFFRNDSRLQMETIISLTCVDYIEFFEIVYHLYSLNHNARLRVKIPVSEDDCSIDSIWSLWKTANWYEREVWDLYGIKFNGHPDLRRILLYEEFKGHPLRKDYPINKRQPLIGPLN